MNEKENHLISVIIPVYNVENYLERCLDSVLNQSYENLEVILVDDGSTDNSGSICDEFATKDTRIKVIHKENGGLSSARNKGLEDMTGSYLTFIDSDDVIHKDMIKNMYSVSLDNNAQIAVCEFQEFYSDCAPEIAEEPQVEYRIVDRKSALLMYDGCYGTLMLSACNKLYKRAVFEEIRFPLGRKCEDLATIYKVVFNYERVAVLKNKYYYYFIRTNSIMHSSKRPTFDAVMAFDEFIQYCEINIEEADFKQKMVSLLAKRKADTVLEDYYYSVKRKVDKAELMRIKELYYNIRPQLKKMDVLRLQYRVFEFCPLLFYVCVDIYYRLIGRSRN